jgi:hypothetical protein
MTVYKDAMKKPIAGALIIGLLLIIVPTAHSISAKTQGKLALAAILSGVAILTKHLVKRDIRTVEELHARLGKPDRVLEFEHGFDRWRIEHYNDRRYFFRNGVLQTGKRNP